MSQSVPNVFPVSVPTANLAAQSELGHAVRFYSDEVRFFDELASFFCVVLRSHEPVIIVATESHCNLIREMLDKKGCDDARNPLVLLEAEATLTRFMVNNQPDATRFRDIMVRTLARARGGYGRNEQRVTIFGEMVAVLWAEGNTKAVLDLEELWNDFARTQRFSLICAYPARFFEGSEHWEAFSKVCGRHSSVLPDESYAALKSDDERLRTITSLQLKARALDKEMARHKAAETSLQSCIEERSAEVQQTRAQLEDLSGHLVRLRDQECRCIAQELHDSTAQLLSVLAMYVDLLEGNKESFNPASAQLIARSNSLVKQILLEVRSLSYGLYPPTLDIVGLGSALEWYCTRFTERTGSPVAIDIPDSTEPLPHPVEMAMFRLVQECLAKVQEHAAGSPVTVRLSSSPEGATLSVSVSATSTVPAVNSSDIFGSTPSEIRKRVRQLNGRAFTISDAWSSGVSVFFPGHDSGGIGPDSILSAS
jgi:signal transduction histidine kinase